YPPSVSAVSIAPRSSDTRGGSSVSCRIACDSRFSSWQRSDQNGAVERSAANPEINSRVETTAIETPAVIDRLIRIGDLRVFAGLARGIHPGRAVSFSAKELARDHAADHRAGDAAQQGARHQAAHAHAAGLAEHALHRPGLPDFRACRHARQRLRSGPGLFGGGSLRGWHTL